MRGPALNPGCPAGTLHLSRHDRILAQSLVIRPRGRMSKIVRTLLVLVVLGLIGGAVFLLTWDIPAPTARVEKTIPNERFNK